MSKRPARLRRRPSRAETRNLSEVLEFILDHEELVLARAEEKKKEIEAAVKKKTEESFLVKKFTFGQMFFWVWITQPVFGLFWYLILRGL